MNKTCCFFGHRWFYGIDKIKERLKTVVEEKIKDGFDTFLMGNHGDFDKIALLVCRELKKIYPYIEIIVVVTSLSIFTKKKVYKNIDAVPECERKFITQEELEKETSVAEEKYSDVKTLLYNIEEEHFKNKITITNKHIVDDSDLLICYVDKSKTQSGAKTAMNYAKRQDKEVINLYKQEDNPFYKCEKFSNNLGYNKNTTKNNS